jgi:flagellar basal-body rod protein FlgF
MIRGLYTSAAGMAAQLAKQDVIANNLANANSSGYKQDVAVFRTRLDKTLYRLEQTPQRPDAEVRRMGGLSTGVYLDEIAVRFESGAIRQTENPFDFALEGDGFFVLEEANGTQVLTRDGSFTRSAEGFLVDKSGRMVLGEGNAPVQLGSGRVQVARDGGISIDRLVGDTLQQVPAGRLMIVTVADPRMELEKRGDNAFTLRDGAEPQPAQGTFVVQEALEASTVNPVREMVEMISVHRAYEASQRLVTAQDETLGKAVNEIAR